MWEAKRDGDFIVITGKDGAELIEGTIETLADRVIDGKDDKKVEVFIGPLRYRGDGNGNGKANGPVY